MISRRSFLIGSTALAALPLFRPSRMVFASDTQTLTAGQVQKKLLPEGQPMPLWGYNGSTPGPTLRLKKGERLAIEFKNELPQSSAVHWHGIRIDNKMDGVPDLTQKVVSSGQSFAYDFQTPDAGTFWYHAHNQSWEQVARGLYGALIVEELSAPDVDYDVVALIDDWRLDSKGKQVEEFNNRHDQAHGGQLGNFAKAMFEGAPAALREGDRVRLRLINTATDRVFPIKITGLNAKLVALDGMPLAKVEDFDTLSLAPAQRADVIGDVVASKGEEVRIEFITKEAPYSLGRIPVEGKRSAEKRAKIQPLPSNGLPQPNFKEAVSLDLLMEGGAMSPSVSKGGDIWSFNGKSGMDETPFHSFKRSQTGRIKLINHTSFGHAIHLHGHHFQEVLKDGLGPLRDTILVNPSQTREIVCVFDNPGKWLFHCHMLGHQASGMKTWIEVLN